jgi:LmbE family N-acetylglucosaminyl deacetylase
MSDSGALQVTPPSRHLDHWTARAAEIPARPPLDALGVRPGDGVLVFAAHPDDETFGVGGTLAALAAAGVGVHVLALTKGEAALAHLGLSVPSLGERRRGEFHEACRQLGVTTCQVLDLGDGRLDGEEDLLDRVVGSTLATHRPAHVLTPWWDDPHADHAAVGRAVRRTASDVDIDVSGYLIWALHWTSPDTIEPRETRMTVLTLDESHRAARAAAVGCYTSQTEPLLPSIEPVLPLAMRRNELEIVVAG